MASLTGRVTPGDTLTLPRKHAGRVWPLRRCRSCRALNCVLRGSVVAMANKLQGNTHETDVASYRASSRPKTVESGVAVKRGGVTLQTGQKLQDPHTVAKKHDGAREDWWSIASDAAVKITFFFPPALRDLGSTPTVAFSTRVAMRLRQQDGTGRMACYTTLWGVWQGINDRLHQLEDHAVQLCVVRWQCVHAHVDSE